MRKYVRNLTRGMILPALFLLGSLVSPLPASASGLPSWKLQASPTYTVSGVNNIWSGIAWGATAPNGSAGMGLFVGLNATGGIMTSPDGITWTMSSSAPRNAWTSVAWSPQLSLFAVVATSGVGNQLMTSPDGVTWTVRTASANGWWLSIVWGDTAPNGLGGYGLFVAVGYPGLGDQVMTSPDGINWTSRTAASPIDWNAVVWAGSVSNGLGGQGLFLAVAQSSTGDEVMTSPDGVTWTSHSESISGAWNGVAWGDTAPNGSGGHGLFVSVNAGEVSQGIMTSPDGINWTTVTIPINDWYNVIWAATAPNGLSGQGLFVVVGYSSGAGREILTSPDGVTWTRRTNSADANFGENYTGIEWSPELGLFVALNYTSNIFMTSPDGVTWTDHVTPAYPVTTDSPWNSVVWGATAPNGSAGQGLFVAVAPSGAVTNQVMTSPDGINWTGRTAAAANTWQSVTWSPSLGIFAAVASSFTGGVPNQIMTSSDGVTWTTHNVPAANNWNAITWSPDLNLFVTVASSGSNRVMTSPDAVTWTEHAAAAAIAWQSVVWSHELGMFVAVATTGSGNRVMTSIDGATWTSRTSAADNTWKSVTWAPSLGMFAAVGTTGTNNRVMTSTDGITWTSRTDPVDIEWNSVTWSPEFGMFVAVGNTTGHVYANPTIGNFVMTSTDGITWTASSDAINNWWTSVAWAPSLGIFAAVANSGVSLISGPNIGDLIMTSPSSPIITAIHETPSSTSLVITWTTDQPSTSQINYGSTSAYGSSTVLDSATVTSHSVSVSGLTCGTVYHYEVSSTFSGFNAVSTDRMFSTSACLSVPSVDSAGASSISGSSAVLNGSVTGTGGHDPTSRGFYWGATTVYENATVENGSFSAGAFTANISGLNCNTTYHFQVYAINTIGMGTSTPDATFTTSACSTTVSVTSRGGANLIFTTPVGGTVPAAPSDIPAPPALEGYIFVTTHFFGQHGAEIKKLQEYLNTHGFVLAASGAGSPGNETEFFGTLTKLSLIKFQETHAADILLPLGYFRGTGNFGPITRAFTNLHR